MASGVPRSKFLPVLIKSLGWHRGRMYNLLGRKGYPAPWLDEERVLKILAEEGVSTKRYESFKAKRRPDTQPAVPVAKASMPQSQPPFPKGKGTQAGLKISSTMRMKLIPRLARLLPQGDNAYGKQLTRNILREGGYRGPKWSDEGRALGIFQKRGISIDEFERVDKSTPAVPGHPEPSHHNPMNGTQYKRVMIPLLQGEHLILEEIKTGKRRQIGDVENCLLMALNECRRIKQD